MKENLDKKLAVKERLIRLEPEFIRICDKAVLKFGKLSTSYLMRKTKLSASGAKEIYDEYLRET